MLNFNSSIRLFFFDQAKGLKTRQYYKNYLKTFAWSEEKIRDYQNSKLRELVTHTYNCIPFYKEKFDRHKINPKKVQTIADLKLLPPLTRDEIVDNYDTIIDKSNTYQKIFKSSSSGSTGIPLSYIHDIDGESAGFASLLALYSICGYSPGMKRLHIWGNPDSVKKWNRLPSKLKNKLFNQINYPAYLLNDKNNFNNLLNLIIKEKPQFIDGYTSSIISFAQWLQEHRIKIKGVKAIFTTAENLNSISRDIIKSQIAEVYDLYGCGEINGVAMQTPFSEEYLIFDPHVIVEKEHTSSGYDEILITDLNNKIMPFIRYKPNDLFLGLRENINSSKLNFSSFDKIVGRSTDVIQLKNGQKLHPVNVLGGTTLRQFPQIKKHKVIWNGEILNFQLECKDKIDIDLLKRKISESLEGYEVDFIIELKEKLFPSENGKFRYVEIVK